MPIDPELEELLQRFNGPVKPTPDSQKKMAEVHDKVLDLAILIYESVPYCREKHTALTLLQQTKMMVNEAICKNQIEVEHE